jgi:hypothetical protein
MRLLYYLLPVVVGLLAGCADRTPAIEARVGVHFGYVPAARRTVEDVRHVSGTLPNFDMSKLCRASERTGCLEEERDAKIELQRQWPTFSEANRSTCMPSSTAGVEPSYVELLTCFEMASAQILRRKPLWQLDPDEGKQGDREPHATDGQERL